MHAHLHPLLDLAHLRGGAGGGDDSEAAAVRDDSAGEEQVDLVLYASLRVHRTQGLADSHRLASE